MPSQLRQPTSIYPPPSPEQSERCPGCGGARHVTINGLTGEVVTSCPTCEQRAERKRIRAAWEVSAIKHVAMIAGLDLEKLQRRIDRRRGCALQGPGPRAHWRWKEKPCRHCQQPFTPTGPNARYCQRAECETERQRNRVIYNSMGGT